MNVQVSGNSSDFAGKFLGHMLERSRALGLEYAHGPTGELMWYYTNIVQSDKIKENWGVVAVAIKGLIETKKQGIEQLRDDVNHRRFATIEDARKMLIEALTMENEMEELQEHLEAMANV